MIRNLNPIWWFAIIASGFLIFCGINFSTLLAEKNLANWDAEHYSQIAHSGYDKEFRTAFFPGFPYLWKATFLNNVGISLFNLLLYLVSFNLLQKNLNISKSTSALYLTLPSALFFFLPYSESLFFLFSTILILGIKNKKRTLVYGSLFLLSITRPSFTVVIPALLLMETIHYNKIKTALNVVMYLMIAGISIIAVSCIQYMDTQEWFQFFSAQSYWGNKLQIPSIPFTSWGTKITLMLDGIALLIGLISGLIFVGNTSGKLTVKLNKIETFSFAYLAGICLIVLLFRGGSLFNLSRFVFANPFIILAFNYLFKLKMIYDPKQILTTIIAINIFWAIFFGSYLHLHFLLLFNAATLWGILLIWSQITTSEYKTPTTVMIVILGIVLNIFLLVNFLNFKWVA